jgi:hypothetical protein
MLLLGLPKSRVFVSGDLIHTQPTTADLLPLTRFVLAVLESVRHQEFIQAVAADRTEIVFRFAAPGSYYFIRHL